LFEATGVRSERSDDEPHLDRAAMKGFLVEKFAASMFEFTCGGLRKSAVTAVGEIERPLMRVRIVKAQAHSFEVSGRAVCAEFDQICVAVPNRADGRPAVTLNPVRRTAKRRRETAQVGFPCAYLEIKVVLTSV